MPAVGLALLALATAPAAPPPGKVVLSGPRLSQGDELVYRGEVVETSYRISSRFTKKYTLGVRVFVFDATADAIDCAVLTTLTPQNDEKITAAVKAASGELPTTTDHPPAVRLDLIRVDDRGHVRLLLPTIEPPPIALDDHTKTADPPLVSTDGPPTSELGIFLPLPLTAVAVGDTWDTSEPHRPPVVWSATHTAVWNGRRVVDVTGVQHSDGYDSPETVPLGWKRTEAVLLSPTDGVVSTLSRRVIRRRGNDRESEIATSLELQPSDRHVGVKYREVRREVETAWVFANEFARLRHAGAKPDRLEAHRREVERYVERHPTGTGFRPAIEAVLRRNDTNAAPPVVPLGKPAAVAALLAVGQPAPDFRCTDVDRPTVDVRLSAGRDKPTVLVFFKPGTVTSEETLTVCEALFRRFGERATVLPLALGGDLLAAAKQRAGLKYSVPVFDGSGVRDKYAVRSYPQFFLIDGEGTVRWTFDAGIGPEVGSLVKKELEKLLAEASK